jgi:sporulation protein YlmC with PRC-barrel domain
MSDRLLLSELQRCHVVSDSGRRIGRVFDVRVREEDDAPPRLEALVVGPRGLLRRLGVGRGSGTEVPWRAVVRRDGSTLVARDTAAT